MMRWFVPGLAMLALMVAPFSEPAAQAAADAPSGEAAPWQEEPAAGDGAGPVEAAADVQAEGMSLGEPAEAPAPEAVLAVPASAVRVQDDLAPGAVIVGDGQPLGIEEAVAMAIRNGLDAA